MFNALHLLLHPAREYETAERVRRDSTREQIESGDRPFTVDLDTRTVWIATRPPGDVGATTDPDRADPDRADPDRAPGAAHGDRRGRPADAGGTGAGEWWRDPRLPWTGRPGRSDLLCLAGLWISGATGLALLPVRAALAVGSPLGLAALTGSRTSVVILGALAAVGRMDLWWLGLLLATLSVVKWDPLYWWAGHLWGRGLVEMTQGRSARAARRVARVERLARRWGGAAIASTYVVAVVPEKVVYASVGASGMSLRRFLLVDLATAFVTRCLYLYLGYRIGQPVVDVLDAVADVLWWISLPMLVVALVGLLRSLFRAPRPATDPGGRDHGAIGRGRH